MAVATASTAHAPRNVTPGLGPRPTPPLRPRAELLTVVILVVLLLIVAAFQHAIVVLALQRVQLVAAAEVLAATGIVVVKAAPEEVVNVQLLYGLTLGRLVGICSI